VIEEILPSLVVSAEAFDDSTEAILFPEETALIARAVERRKREFATTRLCARRALAILGLPPTALLSGVGRAPLWPDGVVGSMTHCAGYRGAALAYATNVWTIGIDAEPHDVLPTGVLDIVALPKEQEQVSWLQSNWPETHWDRLLFSIKECVYKAWFPLAGNWLGFQDADVTIHPVTSSFDVELLVPGPRVRGVELTKLSGRLLVRNGLLITAIAL
jgi:4'-phosphopantetheinyl transferase EntD